MNKKSSLFSLVLILCLILSIFAGCAQDEKTASSPTTKETTSPPTQNASTTTKEEESTPTPTPVETKGVKAYSIEMDFQIEIQALGIVFGCEDAYNYLMWQVNIKDYEDQEQVTFKPHIWVDGQYEIIDQFEISEAIKWDDRNKTHHIKIDVNEDNEITTYINDVKVHTYKHDYAAYNLFGFRECVNEAAYVDNVVIKDTVKGEILEQLNFDDGENPFYEGEIDESAMDTPSLYLTALSTFTNDICILE